MRKNLKSIVDELKAAFRPLLVPGGKVYDALRQMDLRTGCQDDEAFKKCFVQKNGTREEFIKLKEERHGL